VRLVIVQPVITNYRLPVYLELSQYVKLYIIHSSHAFANVGLGDIDFKQYPQINFIEVPAHKISERYSLRHQSGILRQLWKLKPDAVITFADMRYVSFWTILVVGKILGISVYSHGHGLYKKLELKGYKRLLYKSLYWLILKLSKTYLCYTQSVLDSFLAFGFSPDKLKVIENSIINEYPVTSDEKTGDEHGILFIGRLREGSGIEKLLKVASQLYAEGTDISVHLIGDGTNSSILERYQGAGWLHYHGMIYDQRQIAEISRQCSIGCYPGNAGLSIVHYMSLSLIPITHNYMSQHQGPEPSYIVNGENGILLDRSSFQNELHNTIKTFFDDRNKLINMSISAHKTYLSLVEHSAAKRICNTIMNISN